MYSDALQVNPENVENVKVGDLIQKPLKSAPSSTSATVDAISEPEIDDVAGFLARQVRSGEAKISGALSPAQRLRWLLLENPRRAAVVPLGWRIRDNAGAIVGAAVCVPMLIGCGEFRSVALMFAKFFVDPPYRGMGLGILMRFIREGRRFPLFCTSTNAVAGELFQKLGAKPIPQMDHTMLGVARVRPLAEEMLVRRLKQPVVARVLSAPAVVIPGRLPRITGGSLTRLNSTEEVDQLQLQLPLPSGRVAVVRDRAYVHWRYFTGERDKHVYCFASKDNQRRLIVVNEVRSGHRGQIRVLNVLDVWPPASADVATPLAAALAQQYAGRFDALWLRSQPPQAENALAQAGFRRHLFPAQLGWFIDKSGMLPPAEWYSVPGESE